MPTRKERQEAILGENTDARQTRGRRLLALDSLDNTAKEDSFTSYLESRKSKSELLPTTPKKETPTFKETQESFLNKAKVRAGEELEKKPVVFGLPFQPERKLSENFFNLSRPEKDEAKRDLISSFFFGRENDNPLGRSSDGFIESTKDAGLVGTLYGTILKSGEKRQAERYEKLVQTGVEPDRAYQIARAWAKGGALPTDITDAENSSMKWFTTWENAFIGLELLDLLAVGKLANAPLKGLARGAQHQLFIDVAKTKNAKQARDIIALQYPELVGTEGIDEMIYLALQSSTKDNWGKILADTKTGKKIIDNPEKVPVKIETEAQQIFYKEGIPVLRGGQAARAEEIVNVRDEIAAVLREEKEGNRLSNSTILDSERKAGSLDFSVRTVDEVPIFTTTSGRLKVGERVSLSEKVATESLGGGSKARQLKAKVDDLVRLDDGTFVYAPRGVVGKGMSPSIKSVQLNRQKQVQAIERKRATDIRKADAVEKTRINAEMRAKADAIKVSEQARVEQIAKAKKIVGSAREVEKARVATIRAEAKVTSEKIRAEAKVIATAISNSETTVKKTVTKIGQVVKKIARAEVKARIAIVRTRNLKNASTAEKAERIKIIRSVRDKEVAKLTKKKKDLQKAIHKEKGLIEKTRGKQTSHPADEIARMKDDVAEKVANIKKDTTRALDEAKATLKESGEPATGKPRTKPQKSATLQAFREGKQSLAKTQSEGDTFRPLDSEGEVLKSKMNKEAVEKLKFIRSQYGDIVDEWPEEYRRLGNEKQAEIAIDMVVESPADIYQRYTSGGSDMFGNKTSRANIATALLDHPFVRESAERVEAVTRQYASEGTWIAQQLQARVAVDKLDALSVMTKMYRTQADVIKKRNINMNTELGKERKLLGSEYDEIAVASEEMTEAFINKNIC